MTNNKKLASKILNASKIINTINLNSAADSIVSSPALSGILSNLFRTNTRKQKIKNILR